MSIVKEEEPIKLKVSGLSIKLKITLVIVTLIITALSTVGFIASYMGSRALSQQAENNLTLITGQKSNEYNKIFSRLQEEIDGVALFAKQTFARANLREDLNFRVLMPWTGKSYGSPEQKYRLSSDILPLQRIGLLLQGLVEKNPYIELGYLATANNVMVFDKEEVVGVVEAEQGYTPTKRPWYIDAEQQQQTIWTQPYVDVNTKKLTVTCATPVFNSDNSLIGVLGFDVLLNTIQEDIISLDIGYDSWAFLLSKKGNMLAKPGMDSKNISWNQTVKTDNALETDNVEFKEIVQKMIDGDQGIGSHTEAGDTVIVAYAPIAAINASVGVAVSKKEVMQPAIDIQRIIITVWVVVLLISIFIGLFIGNSITKPINQLTMQADSISQGKVDLEAIHNTRNDEIGVLIEAFNRLVISLQIAISRKRR